MGSQGTLALDRHLGRVGVRGSCHCGPLCSAPNPGPHYLLPPILRSFTLVVGPRPPLPCVLGAPPPSYKVRWVKWAQGTRETPILITNGPHAQGHGPLGGAPGLKRASAGRLPGHRGRAPGDEGRVPLSGSSTASRTEAALTLRLEGEPFGCCRLPLWRWFCRLVSGLPRALSPASPLPAPGAPGPFS